MIGHPAMRCSRLLSSALACGLAGGLAAQQARIEPEQKLLAFVRGWQQERFYALFHKEPAAADAEPKRVGWFSFRFEVRTDQDPPIAVGIVRQRMVEPGATRRDEIAYELVGTGRVLWAQSRAMQGERVWTATMRRRLDGRMSQARWDGEQYRTRVVPHLSDSLDLQMLAQRQRLDRDSGWYRERRIDPFADEPETQRHEKAAWESTTAAGRTFGTTLFEDDKEYRVAYGGDGIMDSMVGAEWQSYRWPRHAAQAFANGCIPTFLELRNVKNLEAMRLTWRDGVHDGWPQTRTQRWSRREPGVVAIELFRDRPVSPAQRRALPFWQQARYLLPERFIPSDHPRIVALARETVGEQIRGQASARRAARRLVVAVRARLGEMITLQFCDALRVLARGRGDCKDHTVLLIALARAAGIPARLVKGYAYGGSVRPWGFGGHVWAELHDGRQWFSVDAMHDQIYCAATHIIVGYGFGAELPPGQSRDLTIESFRVGERRWRLLPSGFGK